jgi:nitrate reductase cytochrome c-type subunit
VRAAHKDDDHLTCASCHARETVAQLTPNRAFCVTCHADQAKHKPARDCSSCHFGGTPAALHRRMLGGR